MAWTTPRTWLTSEVVTAAQMNAHVRDNLNALNDRLQIVRKTADESVTSSTTLQNDDTLALAVVSGQSYIGRVVLFVNSGTQTADLKVGFTFPTSTLFSFGIHGLDTAATSPTGSATESAVPSATSGSSTLAVGAGSDCLVIVEFSLAPTASGTVQFQWAQNTSSGTAVTVKAGSFMKMERVTV